MTDNNDLDTNVSEISSYLVFQCIKCRLIVGDSMSFQNTSKEANTIILSSASNIKRTGELFTCKSGFDVGSTFFSLCCTGCDQVIGRYYLTTSKDLDSFREMFTFDIKSISSYELGKSPLGNLPEPSGASNCNDVAEDVTAQEDSSLSLHDDIAKIQHVICNLADRLGAVESLLESVHNVKRSRLS